MANFCIFKIDINSKKRVSFVESYDDYSVCYMRCDDLNQISHFYNSSARYVMRKLEDSENPYTYNPFVNFIVVSSL